MKTLRSQEGMILVDHSATGLGLEGRPGRKLEAATYTCRHCHRVVILNPDRARARGYCPKCSHRVCDQCEVERVASGGECRDMERVISEIQEAGARGWRSALFP